MVRRKELPFTMTDLLTIDLEYVMHGSYNWTKAANYNGETLVTSVDRELVKKFATEFNETIVENS